MTGRTSKNEKGKQLCDYVPYPILQEGLSGHRSDKIYKPGQSERTSDKQTDHQTNILTISQINENTDRYIDNLTKNVKKVRNITLIKH